MTDGRRRVRASQTCLTLAVLAGIWADVLALTGGFGIVVGGMRISSRSPRPVMMVAVLFAALAWLLTTPGARWRTFIAEWEAVSRKCVRWFGPLGRAPRVVHVVVALACVMVVTLGIVKGALVAGGSDSYGYVSEAHLWATGRLRDEQPVMNDVTWSFAPKALAPLGYRPAPQGAAIVPVYPPGLPMAMGLFERLFGRQAVFYVVPLLGGLAVWATYLMGASFAGRAVGASAAVLLATSPVFLYQLMNAMSDVPVTAWWTLSLALVTSRDRSVVLVAGLLAGAAILTRPNLAPLLLVPAGYFLWQLVSDRSRRGHAVQSACLYAAGLTPALIGLAVLNTLWYGAPLANGYGDLGYFYRWEYLWQNVVHYPHWLLQTEFPAVMLALAALFFLRNVSPQGAASSISRTLVIIYVSVIAVTFACYAFYLPLDVVWCLRFLLPAFPPLMILASRALVIIAVRVTPNARGLTMAVLVSLCVVYGLDYSRSHSVFDLKEETRRYQTVGTYIARRLPERAVFLAMEHSGSARYYSLRLTVRYDVIPPSDLDSVVGDLRRLGYHPYFLLERWEEPLFRDRFDGQSLLARLDWKPAALSDPPNAVAIYDPADRTILRGQPERVSDLIR